MTEGMDVAGKAVLVVGAARSGVAAARVLKGMGARVTLNDAKPEASLPGVGTLRAEGIRVLAGGHPRHLFRETDLIVVSPGVPLSLPPLAEALAHGVPVMGELELAYRIARAPFLAVTGTNGKSTTTALVGEILREAGVGAYVGGNIGNALCADPEALVHAEVVVAEVSSFQLETVETFRPRWAALLNLTPDHLDRYESFEAYAAAKARIFRNQGPEDWLVLNQDDPRVVAMAGQARCRVAFFSRRSPVACGVFAASGQIVSTLGGQREPILPVAALRLVGTHNLENALAAAALSLLAGCPVQAVARALARFPGLEHRMELVRELGGVRYINDSKGTNVGAVMRSLESLSGPVILIAGGLDKGSDFAPLVPLVRERVRLLVLLGAARERMARALSGAAEMAFVPSMEAAVELAARRAVPGDTVLLSPACASFDMFPDFEARGRCFKAAVHSLGGGGGGSPPGGPEA